MDAGILVRTFLIYVNSYMHVTCVRGALRVSNARIITVFDLSLAKSARRIWKAMRLGSGTHSLIKLIKLYRKVTMCDSDDPR